MATGIIKEVKMGNYDSYVVKIEGNATALYAGKWDNDFWASKKVGDTVEYEIKDGKYINLPKTGGKGFVGKKATVSNASSNPQTALLAAANFCSHRPAANAEHILVLAEKFLNWLDKQNGTSLPTSENVPLPTQKDEPKSTNPDDDDLPF